MKQTPILFFNRYTNRIETETVYGEAWLKWLYTTSLGKGCVELFVKKPWLSHWYAKKMHHAKSRSLISNFIQHYHIDMGEFEKAHSEFHSFNDFFCRRLTPQALSQRLKNTSPQSIVFPADGRHLALQNISATFPFTIKGHHFNLKSLLKNDALVNLFEGGTFVCSRLCPTDYHRFHFPVSGIPGKTLYLNGPLYSVSPIALKSRLKALWENKRTLTLLETQNMGTVAMVEVGATLIGSIQQTFQPGQAVQTGDEKGFFQFGGSTLLTLFQKNTITLAPDLIECTQKGIELYARFGDHQATVSV